MNGSGQRWRASTRRAFELALAAAAIALAPARVLAAPPAPAGPEVLLDPSGTLSAAQLLAPPWSERFEPLRGPRSFGSTAPPIWIRFTLENPTDAPQAIGVTWDFPLVERLALYLVEADGPRLVAQGGLALPAEARQFTFRGAFHEAEVTVPPRARLQALLRAETRAAAFAGLTLRPSAGAPGREDPFTLLRFGVGIGLVLILAALALSQGAAFRDPAYLFYALFVLAYGAYAAAITGLGPLLLWPEAPGFALIAQPLFSGVTGFAGLLFARAYMHTRRRGSRLDRPLLVVAVCNLLAGLLGFLSVPAANLATAVLAAAALALSLTEGLRAVRAGSQRARWFVLGFAAFALFGALFALCVLGVIRPEPSLLWGLQAGFVLTSVALALALAERQVSDSEERFRVAFETSPDAITITRVSDGRYVAVNPAFTRITGWAPEEVVGRSATEVGIWSQADDRARLFEALARQGATHNQEFTFRLKDGRTGPGLLSARTIEIGGEPHLLSITREITALKEAEAERARLQDELRQSQKLEAVGRLAGGVAHDFNNLLSVIRSNASASLAELPADDPSRESFQEIRDAAARAAELTRQLQTFGLRRSVAAERLDLSAMLAGMQDGLRALLGPGPTLTCRPGPSVPPILADRNLVEQLLVNLVLNALEAVRGCGDVQVSTFAAEVPAGLPDRNPGPYAVLEVKDQGAGMSPEVRDRLFEPFFTTRLQPVGGGPGRGLGLAVVHGIAHQHGGFMEVESEPGRGSTFRAWFPAAAP